MNQTLVLSPHMRAHQILCWQDAITMVFNGKVKVLETYDEVLATLHMDAFDAFEDVIDAMPMEAFVDESLIIKKPCVVVLTGGLESMKRGIKFSRTNVFARDHFQCQLCGEKGDFDTLTYEHVVPRAQGGKTTWENIVAACRRCNTRKGNRTPAQAGMKLLKQPIRPKSLPHVELRIPKNAPAVWRQYVAESMVA